jgi:hypothetical protein
MYDLELVDHGPLPPHERSWRHPSELGPTPADVDNGPSNHLAALALGTLVVVAVAGLVVVMSPRGSSSPLALSATTAPVTALRSAQSAITVPMPGSASAALSPRIPIGALLTSFAAFPQAVTAASQLTLDGIERAKNLPADDDIVLVHTDAATYELPWGQVEYLNLPDGTVVFDHDGHLLAEMIDHHLVDLTAD